MRKFMTSTLGAIFTLASMAGTAVAANYTDTSFGISIDVDDALTKQPLLRDIQSFTAQDMFTTLVIRRAHDLSITDFVDELRHIGYRDNRHNVTLRINGEPIEADIEAGRGLLIPVQGQVNGHPLSGVIGAYSAHSGHGFIVIGSAKPETWPAWKPRMRAMFESVKFVDVDRQAIVREWEDRLKGKKLQYRQANVTGNAPASMPGMYYGGAMHRDYHLCSDGTLKRRSASVGQVTGQNMTLYGHSMNRGSGTWHIAVSKSEPFLVVRDGPEQGYRLEYDNNNFLLDGMPYTITNSELCK